MNVAEIIDVEQCWKTVNVKCKIVVQVICSPRFQRWVWLHGGSYQDLVMFMS